MPDKAKKRVRGNSGLSGWHPEDVKAGIRKKGQTLTSLSVLNGFSPSYLRNALRRPLFDGEQIIAKFLGVAPHVIWPDRYNRNGTSKVQRATGVSLRRAA